MAKSHSHKIWGAAPGSVRRLHWCGDSRMRKLVRREPRSYTCNACMLIGSISALIIRGACDVIVNSVSS